jgi:hypothetical protein
MHIVITRAYQREDQKDHLAQTTGDLRSSRWWGWRCCSCWFWRRVDSYVKAKVLKKHTASIFRAKVATTLVCSPSRPFLWPCMNLSTFIIATSALKTDIGRTYGYAKPRKIKLSVKLGTAAGVYYAWVVLSGLLVMLLATRTKARGFKPGQRRQKQQHDFIRRSKAFGPTS